MDTGALKWRLQHVYVLMAALRVVVRLCWFDNRINNRSEQTE